MPNFAGKIGLEFVIVLLLTILNPLMVFPNSVSIQSEESHNQQAVKPEPKKILQFSVHPYRSRTELNKMFMPLLNYLSKELGVIINLNIGRNYDEHIEYVGNNRVDMAYMGPVSYVKLVEKYGRKHILGILETGGSTYFIGKIFVRKESKLQSLSDLKGVKFAFGDTSSTMSYLVPLYMLIKAGIYPDHLKNYNFLNSHDNVALGVLSGDYKAGAVKEAVYNKYEKSGLRALADTPQITEHLFVATARLPQEYQNKIKELLQAVHHQRSTLQLVIHIKKTVTAIRAGVDEDYDDLRKILHTLRKYGVKY